MLRRRQINADPGRSKPQAVLAAAWNRLRSLGLDIEAVAWDWGRSVGTAARRLAAGAAPLKDPLARAVWFVEHKLLWPLQDRADGRLPHVSGQLAGTAAVVALAIGVVTLAVVSLQGEEEPSRLAAQPAPIVAAPTTASTTTTPVAGPVLRGAPPSFDVEGAGIADVATDDTIASDAEEGLASASGESETATTSSSKPVPAGPAAMKVARRFADAFVHYEVGEDEDRAEEVFAETATPQLASALAERPPRQPATVEVPQARVLNLVPGPRRGRTYTVSASLLRVGTTSELRLEMKKRNGNWLITDVRG
jgi:hypothetical protein